MEQLGPLLEIMNCYRDVARSNTQMIEELATLVTNSAKMELDTVPSRMVLDILERHNNNVKVVNERLAGIIK